MVTPEEPLAKEDFYRLETARTTRLYNFTALDKWIEGTIPELPIFVIVQTDDGSGGNDHINRKQLEVERRLHNYLSSLYSYHEVIRSLFNKYTNSGVGIKHGKNFIWHQRNTNDPPYYMRRLAFLRGLRIDYQHGGFSAVDKRFYDEIGEMKAYELVFVQKSFVNNDQLYSPEEYVQYLPDSDGTNLLEYIGRFRTERVGRFHESFLNWFEDGKGIIE